MNCKNCIKNRDLSRFFLTLVLASSSAGAIEADRLGEHIVALAGSGSRVTGYPGAQEAAAYLEAQLREAGVEEVYLHGFQAVVPMDQGAGVERLDSGERLALYGVWPNLARTPTLAGQGLEGQLVYAGQAGPGELDGVDLKGGVVLLEYNCGMNWVRAFDLGAAAVVFLAPEQTHRRQGADKFLSTPADLPRFYAAQAQSRWLRLWAEEGGVPVRVWGRMSWQQVQAHNVIGLLPGSDPSLADQAVLLGTYYDAISPVPGVAPGAEQACGVTAWLEVARQLAGHPRRRTVVLVATAGHFQALAGMRALAGEWLSSRAPDSAQGELVGRLRRLEVLYYLGLDLSSHSERLGLVQAGFPFRVRTIEPPLYESIGRFAEQYEREVLGGRMILGGELNPRRLRRLVGQVPERVPTEGAAVQLTGYAGLTLVTAGDERAAFDSPMDKPEAVELERLAAQGRFIAALAKSLIDEAEAGVQIEERVDSFARLKGQVLSWGAGSYGPDRPVGGAWVRLRSLHKSAMGVRLDPVALADSAGRFAFEGVEARTLYLKPVHLEVYSLDASTGEVVMALDQGPQGTQQYPAEVEMDHLEEEVTLVAFPSRPLTLFELLDPRYLFTLDRLRLLDARTQAEPFRYGYCLPPTPREIRQHGYDNTLGAAIEPVAVALAPEGVAVKIVMTTGRYGLGKRLLLLNGEEAAEGKGFWPEEHPRLDHASWRIARDTFRLNRKRLEHLERHGIFSDLLRRLQVRSGELLQEAETALKERRHQAFASLSRRAWGMASRAYGEVQWLILDVVNGVLFFLVLLLPCAYFGERLLLGSTQMRRQAGGVVLVFLVGFLVLGQVHPAFELSLYPGLVLLGFLILALSAWVIWLGLSRLNYQLHLAVAPQVARHRTDTGRTAMLGRALLLGVAQMRRRPWRTGLTCATLALLMFSLLSFTSVRGALRFNQTLIGQGGERNGLLLRLPGWEGLEEGVYEEMRRRFGPERTLARGWYMQQGWLEGTEGRTALVEGVLGLEPGERELGEVAKALVAGRFFAPGEERACLLMETLAKELGLGREDLGARVRFLGSEYEVVGLLSSELFDGLRDINGVPLAPLDRQAQQPEEERAGLGKRGVEPAFAHMSSGRLLILPYAAVRLWGEWSRLASVAVLDPAAEEIAELAEVLGLNLFAALQGRRYLINTVGHQSLSAPADLLVPLLIAALIAFNTMLGSVHERLSEIGTLNAIGLAPLHVAGLFLAEAMVYAVLGSALGYLLGQGMARLGWLYGLFPGLTVNYSSLGAVATLGTLMAVVLLSALYPARQASRLCVPGIERRWRLPPPQGDLLEVAMPFELRPREAGALLAFLAEYLEAYNEQSIGAGFYAESLKLEQGEHPLLRARLWLAPFDQGVSQDFSLRVQAAEDSRFCALWLSLGRRSGDRAAWARANRIFVNDLRRQFLAWRALVAREEGE
jgi:hypothetical protein